ncbi:MAG: hypothetical protein ABW133_10275 [Polyangiaceae bacterium]
MKFRLSLGHLSLLTMLAAGTVAFPAAAEERAPEPPLKSRDAKTAEPTTESVTSTAAAERAPEAASKSRDAKTTSAAEPTVDLKIEGLRKGMQIRVQKEDGPPPEGKASTSCEQDCEVKLPAGSYTLVASQVAPQAPSTTESDASRQRLGHAIGVGGIVAAALGSYLAVGALVARDGTQGEVVSGLNGFFFAGLTCIAVGGGLMIGGFSLAASERTPSTTGIDRTPSVPQRRALTDMGVSLSGSF